MYTQDYWQAKMQNKQVASMAMLPMMSVAAALTNLAGTLWHPWGRKRTKELRVMSSTINQRASDMRRNGLGWAAGIFHDEHKAGYILSNSSFKRYFGEAVLGEPAPNLVPLLVSSAIAALFCVRDIAIKISAIEHDERSFLWIDELIEELSESPTVGNMPNVSDKALRALGDCGVLLECEGLTYMLALIEDRHVRVAGKEKKKKSSLSDAELSRLAAEIGVDPTILKEVFETVGSSWWQRSVAYKTGATTAAGAFFASSYAKPVNIELIERWQTGSISLGESDVICGDADTFSGCETVVCMLITLFLSCRGSFMAEGCASLQVLPRPTVLLSSN